VAESVDRITRSGGLALPVLPEDIIRDDALRAQPLVDIRRVGGDGRTPHQETKPSGGGPLHGIRVLDLTRVIAGPVCTRTLALLGADVLRIDPPQLPEPEWQHLESGHGKRSALLDARSERMAELLSEADVVVLGYRPTALARLGIAPEELADRYPGLVIAQLTAWGTDQPDRAGFDSLAQAESGIAMAESSDGETPGALPAQALDHSAGYLLAAAVCTTLARRAREGGTWLVRTSLRRIAAELLGMPRSEQPPPERDVDPARHSQEFIVAGRRVVTAAPALPGFVFAPPRPWGTDAPRW
jgi:crotonobetainyl-CoA:carnitine CoA-transferase CaiB-like acyl-CoA transferase